MAKSLADLAIERENETPQKSLADLAIEMEQGTPTQPKSLADLAIEREKKDLSNALEVDATRQSAEDKGTLAGQMGQIFGKSVVLSQPGVSTYGKEKVKGLLDEWELPVYFNPAERESAGAVKQSLLKRMAPAEDPDPAGAGARLAGPIGGAAQRVGKGITSTLDALDLVLNAPIRVGAETIDAARKRAQWMAGGMEGELPEYSPLRALKREPGAAHGAMEIYEGAYRESMGKKPQEELTPAEQIPLAAAGLLTDFLGAGALGKAMAAFKQVPGSVSMGENIEAALGKAGVAEKAVHPARITFAAKKASAPYGLPDRIRVAREEVQKIGQMAGATPKELTRLDAEFLKRMGEQGKYLEKSGNVPTVSRTLFPLKRSRIEEIQKTDPTGGFTQALEAPFGGQTKPSLWRSTKEAFRWDVGAPEGASDVVRQVQGRALARGALAEKEAKAIGRSFETPERAEQVMLYQDAAATAKRAEKWHKEISGGSAVSPEDLAAKTAAVEREKDLLTQGFAPKTPDEKRALQFMGESFDEMHSEVEKKVGELGHLDDFSPRRQTAESLAKQVKINRAPGAAGKPGFMKSRHPWQEGITLEGTEAREFYKHPAAMYANQAKKVNLAIATADTEGQVLRSYGRKIPAERYFNPEEAAAMKAKGQEVWTQRYGPDKGSWYVVDSNTAKFLGHVLPQPGQAEHPFWKFYDSAHSWLKGRMTTTRPAYLWRNFWTGNLLNMWAVDVMPTRIPQASKIYASMKYGQGFTKLNPAEIGTAKIFARDAMNPKTVVAGKPIAEWWKELSDNKIISPGQIAYETGTAGAEAPKRWFTKWYNPMSRENALQRTIRSANSGLENMSKIAVYVDRRSKGYSPREAAKFVAESLFNYDELSPVLASKVVKRGTAFPIWMTKNLGMQFANLAQRPNKMMQYLATTSGIQDFDPMDEEELRLVAAAPADMKRSELLPLPGLRGEGGARRVMMTANVTPQGALALSGLDKLARGEVKSFGTGFLQALGDLMAPIPGMAYKQIVKSTTGMEPTFLGQAMKTTGEEYSWASKPIAGIARAIQKYNPTVWKWVSDKNQWLVEAKTSVKGKQVPVGYKINRDFLRLLESMDPSLNTLNRLLPQFTKEQDYKTVESVMFLGKDIDVTPAKAAKWQLKTGKKILEQLQTEERRQKETGEMRGSFAPMRGAGNE